MRWNNHKVIIALLFPAVIIAFFVVKMKSENDVWQVIGEIPPSIGREKGIDTATYYIIRQTHEPLFRCDDLQNYTSKVLKDWSRSVDYRRFVFSPDTSLKFNTTSRLTEDFFVNYISSVTTRYGVDFKLSRATGSVTVEFKEPQKQFLYFLTWYENAPAIKAGNIEYGLGEYLVTSYNERKIVFDRKTRVRGGYNRIIYRKYEGESDPVLENRKIQDFNLLSSFQQPEWIKKEYVGIKNPDPRTIVLLINHPDKRVRKRLHDCLSIDDFRRAFIVKRKEFYDVKTVLPVGIPGGKGGMPEQVCDKGNSLAGGKVVLVNQQDNNDTALASYLNSFYRKTGIRVLAKKTEYQELVNLLKNSKRKPFSYNLLQMVLDTYRPDHKVFFEYVAGEKTFLDVRVPKVESLYKELLKADTPDNQNKIAETLADELNQEGLVLPLYQTYSTVYYPAEIENIIVGKGFSQYPEVADFRW